ncbi:MAG: carboxypeptidase M32, partial [Pseudomonadales bacterium]|nr:carboxypeptidase M32 [Pseudomonadales bacterium]
MTAYQSLEQHFQRIYDLRHVEAIAMWDEASMMPVGGGEARSQAMSSLGVVIHGMVTDPRVAEWADKARDEDLDDWQQANVREIERLYRESTCLPEELVARRSRITSKCEQAWRVHRADNNWSAMQRLLEDVIAVSREEAACRSEASGAGLYDALLDVYEPEMTSATLDELFADLKVFLPPFVEPVIERQKQQDVLPLTG